MSEYFGPVAATASAASGTTPSGTLSVDALLAGGGAWRWNATIGAPVTVTFSFMSALPATYTAAYPESVGFVPFTEAQKAGARRALQSWSEVANISFLEVADGSAGTIRFGTAALPSGVAAWAYYPDSFWPEGGDVWLSNLYSPNLNQAAGTYGYLTMVHEIGHAIGLKHPGNYDASSGGTDGPYLPAAEDNHRYTVMSYFQGAGLTVNASSPMLYDIAAIQYLYGANTATRAGDSVYTFAPGVAVVRAIWDGGGTDTIDLSAHSAGQRLNLAPGSFSTLASGGPNNIAIAFGTWIENAIGGAGGDTLAGNAIGNRIAGGLGKDLLSGGGGADTFAGTLDDLSLDTITDFGFDDRLLVLGRSPAAALASLNLLALTGSASTAAWSWSYDGADTVFRLDPTITYAVGFTEFAPGTADPVLVLAETRLSLAGTVLADPAWASSPVLAAAAAQAGTLLLQFSAPVRQVGFDLGDADAGGGATMQFLGAGGALLGTLAKAGAGTQRFTFADPFGVAAIRILDTGAGASPVALDNLSLAAVLAPPPATSTLSIAALAADLAEGQSGTTQFTFAVTRSGDLGAAASVAWTLIASGASPIGLADLAGGAMPSGMLAFAAGQAHAVIAIDIAGDTLLEGDEGFAVWLAAPSAGVQLGTASAAATVRDDDRPVLSIAALAADRPEGDAGPGDVTFLVTRAGDASAPVSVALSVAGSGAAPADAADFAGGLPQAGLVTFAAGETSHVVTLQLAGDTAVEADEGFVVTLSAPSGGATIGTASAAGVIRNDDAALHLAALAADRAEGDAGTTAFTFLVTREGHLGGAASAAWSVLGSGANPADAADFAGFALPSGIVAFAPGEASQVVTVAVATDLAMEADEGFELRLAAPIGATLAQDAAAGVIRNDDVSAVLSVAALASDRAEANGGTVPFTFAVTRGGDLSVAASVSWSVAGSGASPAAAADFAGGVLPGGTIGFGIGETSQTITVLVAGERLVEADEGFAVTLAAPSSGAVLGTAGAAGVIRNDDTGLRVAALSADQAEGSGGVTPFTFLVTREGALGGASSVAWSVLGITGNPASAADFESGAMPTGMLAFAPGEASQVVTLPVLGDALVEAAEAFQLRLSAPVGAILLTAGANGVIRNDDIAATLSVAPLLADRAEGHAGTTAFTFAVTRGGGVSEAVSAAWSVAGSGAAPADAADFAGGVLPSGVVAFAPGETSRIITVEVAGDAVTEPDESFTLSLSAPSAGAVLATAAAAATIRADDAVAAPTLSIAALTSDRAEANGGSVPFTFAVTRGGDLSVAASVSWSVAGSGASPAAAADFAGGVLPGGTIGFAIGETSQTITVLVAGERLVEADEGFAVTLAAPSPGAVLGLASAAGVIRNDDTGLRVAALSADQAEGSGGVTPFTFLVTREGVLGGASSVAWSVLGITGNAASAADFEGGAMPAGSVSFAPGEASQVVTVQVLGDALVEATEAFQLRLSAPVGAILLNVGANGSIRNDDVAAPPAAPAAPGDIWA
jgi:hypothetical protein